MIEKITYMSTGWDGGVEYKNSDIGLVVLSSLSSIPLHLQRNAIHGGYHLQLCCCGSIRTKSLFLILFIHSLFPLLLRWSTYRYCQLSNWTRSIVRTTTGNAHVVKLLVLKNKSLISSLISSSSSLSIANNRPCPYPHPRPSLLLSSSSSSASSSWRHHTNNHLRPFYTI